MAIHRNYTPKAVRISKRSRRRLWWMRLLLPRLIGLMGLMPRRTQVRLQRTLSGGVPRSVSGFKVGYDVLGGVPGFTLDGVAKPGSGRVLLYLHGGGFVAPVMPGGHVVLAGKLARELEATAFVPDYRLAPLHVYPAALDDCEKAYRALLEQGFEAKHILLAGESAGGNLVLGLLQRLRRLDLPMPSCAVPISPVTEMARVHAPPSRVDNAGRDAMLPVKNIVNMLDAYCPDADGSDPELSPILADFSDFPPLYFLVGETEMLLDDTLICARRARAQGVEVALDVWPGLPHAFPLLEALLPEAGLARADICAFARIHLG